MAITNNLVDVTSIKETALSAVNHTTANITSGDTYSMNNNNGTIIIGSNVQGDVTNVTTVDNSVVIIKEGDTYTYNGGDKVINNYRQGEKIALASDFQGTEIRDNSFVIKSSTGNLEIQEARDKFIDYTDAEGNTLAHSYVVSSDGVVDGSDKAEYQVMVGAENSDNQLIAGNGGSSLWGGEGSDEFVYKPGSGNDVVQNANGSDVVNLDGVTLDQIADVSINVGEVNAKFADGGSLKIEGDSNVGYKLGDAVYQVNQETGEWSAKE